MILVSVTHGEGYDMTTEEFWVKDEYWDALFYNLNDLANASMP